MMTRFSSLMMLALLVGVAMIGSDAAWAQDFKELNKNTINNSIMIPKFVAYVAYIVGVFFGATGLLALRRWAIDPDKNSILSFIGRVCVGALLILLPYTLQVSATTIFSADTLEGGGPGADAYGGSKLGAFQRVN